MLLFVVWLLCVLLLVYVVVSDAFDMLVSVAMLCVFVLLLFPCVCCFVQFVLFCFAFLRFCLFVRCSSYVSFFVWLCFFLVVCL